MLVLIVLALASLLRSKLSHSGLFEDVNVLEDCFRRLERTYTHKLFTHTYSAQFVEKLGRFALRKIGNVTKHEPSVGIT